MFSILHSGVGIDEAEKKGRLPFLFSRIPSNKNGSPEWTRTTNPLVNSQVLCRLSYRGALPLTAG
jgi:hypothetical protein